MTRLAIFDIDGTLVPDASSETRFARFLWHKRELGARQLLAYLWFCLRYGLRYRQHVMQKNKAYLSGLSETHVQALAHEFVAESLLPELYAPALERLRAHQAAGDTIALLSGTPQFLAEALAAALDADHSLGALCAIRAGVYGVTPPVRHPYGATKVDAAEELAAAAGLPLSGAIAYGDSMHDAYLFRVVDEVVLVQPDHGLSAAADDEGWEVLPDMVD